MADESYDHECLRAELLGIEKPTYEEYLKNKPESVEVNEEEIDTENLRETESQNENLSGISGRLSELNQRLLRTQKKINLIQSYGSLKNTLKMKLVGNSSQSIDVTPNDAQKSNIDNDKRDRETDESISMDKDKEISTNQNYENKSGTPIRKSDLSKALDNQVNNLDILTAKSEQAEISMNEQTNQMKKMLNWNFFNIGGNK